MDWHWLFSWPLSWPVVAVLMTMTAVGAAMNWTSYGRTRSGSAAAWGTFYLVGLWLNGIVGSLPK